MEQVFAFADAHPELAAVLITSVIWPLLTGMLSLGYHKLEDSYPTAIAYLRAAGFDLPRTLAAIRAAWPPRLPPPPPAMILLLVTLGGGVMGLSGCGGTQELAKYAEAGRDLAARAEPCLVAQKAMDESQCGDDPACQAKVKATYAKLADALDLMHSTWCKVSPQSEGCK